MSELKRCCEELGLKNVATYIQSGNVVFSSDKRISIPDLSKSLEFKVHERFGFDVPVVVRTHEQLKQLINGNPFLNDINHNSEKCYVCLLSGIPAQDKVKQILAFECKPDEFVIVGQDIYLYVPERYSDTKLTNDFFEKKLCVKATSRGWKTLTKLLDIAEKNNKI